MYLLLISSVFMVFKVLLLLPGLCGGEDVCVVPGGGQVTVAGLHPARAGPRHPGSMGQQGPGHLATQPAVLRTGVITLHILVMYVF